jgi:N6-L-threonylcarbamoyladenine synthase
MIVLGIESSCDETAACVLEYIPSQRPRVIAEQISSQIKLHAEYGGVVPELAAREHLNNLPHIVQGVLAEAGTNISAIDGICVTIGPGLRGCLLMGLDFAKGLALATGKRLVGVNHIEGHVLAPFLEHTDLEFPYLALVVSGGHTEIHRVDGVGRYTCLARTLDDAAGEAFDKAAHLLGCAYPGGRRLSELADAHGPVQHSLPKTTVAKNLFSFSGLKTAIALMIEARKQQEGEISVAARAELCSAVQDAICQQLVDRVKYFVAFERISSVVVTGGVSANAELRRRVTALPGVKAFLTSPKYSTDNAAMIAYVGAARGLRDLCIDGDVFDRYPVERMVL